MDVKQLFRIWLIDCIKIIGMAFLIVGILEAITFVIWSSSTSVDYNYCRQVTMQQRYVVAAIIYVASLIIYKGVNAESLVLGTVTSVFFTDFGSSSWVERVGAGALVYATGFSGVYLMMRLVVLIKDTQEKRVRLWAGVLYGMFCLLFLGISV